ncbi:pantetheine-phosphate adenylyltransferase [Salibacteraceae bacterium]|jgi:pantetheine-phosphate adenylyltransferase|nr:pantetheine-phosphate adenylyltransferase [Crocinitomicaceae bacterium]MCH9822308.1 pantetheine-phosphate adenylyltransferase [Bacteroidota bacterium]MDC1203836.1 pantetheine-phosphate adenylyltransferase [Salibacteraceae bacterium]|tara:strand:+ start:245013 stop:245471 length:459 start_codon:yes stop_codon:yes gene_type:complete
MKRAVFPGSFDPITIGHEAIINRALPLFDEIVLAIGVNSNKSYFFTLEERISVLEKCFEGQPKISIASYSGLTTEYCKTIKASHILRGLRTAADFEFERTIALMNKKMAPELETIFLISEPEHSAISSTVVRDILKNGGDISDFVPTNFPKK